MLVNQFKGQGKCQYQLKSSVDTPHLIILIVPRTKRIIITKRTMKMVQAHPFLETVSNLFNTF